MGNQQSVVLSQLQLSQEQKLIFDHLMDKQRSRRARNFKIVCLAYSAAAILGFSGLFIAKIFNDPAFRWRFQEFLRNVAIGFATPFVLIFQALAWVAQFIWRRVLSPILESFRDIFNTVFRFFRSLCRHIYWRVVVPHFPLYIRHFFNNSKNILSSWHGLVALVLTAFSLRGFWRVVLKFIRWCRS